MTVVGGEKTGIAARPAECPTLTPLRTTRLLHAIIVLLSEARVKQAVDDHVGRSNRTSGAANARLCERGDNRSASIHRGRVSGAVLSRLGFPDRAAREIDSDHSTISNGGRC
jgi:hypothetical protein